MSGGGGFTGNLLKKAGAATGATLLPTSIGLPAAGAIAGARAGLIRGEGGRQIREADPTSMEGLLPPEMDARPTMEDIAAKEPDKEKRRRQKLAALMAQGRQGSILTGPGGSVPNNSIGGSGKQLVGA